MEQRIKFTETGKNALATLYPVGKYLKQTTLDQQLLHLIYYRVSQINGCAFCLDMHAKDLRAGGETEQRLYVLDAWREAPFYSDKERAALAWAEALTKLNSSLVPDAVYKEAAEHFTEKEMVDLTLAVTTINTYNRFNIAFGAPVGTYKVGQFA
ncbi:carboxymuconolactone decarboxylase family protein [Niabella drilacis]|uniref:Alkylhydroperoxidase AhpD family core domain-containing protein n=1 Tax=Niabella drilacis (strain DSM 25811 / CCM 8410 / CCUG 62505 / LMG 26954 / E90) TaxID=1285928 RepID=A0A1G6U478_NIADE|nr:carboxymuconolactone decarboxylase family protein [Niabella drilacis]SDD36093.1 alkylhydroperoxidase AhpD family core domain-containing protein [Niabella drilacis]